MTKQADKVPSDLYCRWCGERRYSRAPGVWLPTGCRCPEDWLQDRDIVSGDYERWVHRYGAVEREGEPATEPRGWAPTAREIAWMRKET